jgi:serine/threonine protein kinase/DNA-binding CsgD family transcriptional regulator
VQGVEVLANRYRLVDQLGKGGMAVVWRAYDEVLDRQVAVKVLAAKFAGTAESRIRVLAEARAAARMTHPHVGAVYDYGESVTGNGDRVPFVVMELLSGRSLEQRLRQGRVPINQALKICAQVASALAAAHARGLVHRDVKPANVMLSRDGAKVVDFGLAAVAGEPTDLGGVVLGTPAYLAPERLSGDTVVAATDVYALGLLLYRLLAGRMPWQADTTTQMLMAHEYLEPAPLPPVAGVASVVVDVIQQCLRKEPADRPASADVAAILAQAAGVHVPLGEPDEEDLDDDEPNEPSGHPHRGVAVGSDDIADRSAVLLAASGSYVSRLAEHLDASRDHVELRQQASLLLRSAVGFDLARWSVLDPVTVIWTSCVIDGGQHDERFESELFANEYGQPDVLKLADLADGPRIGTLSASTQGDPRVSARFRNVLAPRGLADELRLVFHDGTRAWGALCLYRAGGRFTDHDIAQLAPVSGRFAAVLRHALLRGTADPGVAGSAPGGVGRGGGAGQGARDRWPGDVEARLGGHAPWSSDPAARVEYRHGVWSSDPSPGASSADVGADRSGRVPRPRFGRGRRDRATDPRGDHAVAPAPAGDPAPAGGPAVSGGTPGTPGGVVTLSPTGLLVGMTDGARAILAGDELAKVAAAVVAGRVAGPADATNGPRYDGRWLAFHVGPRGTTVDVAVQLIRPHQVSELMVSALGLTPSQWYLLGAVVRNRPTQQIAHELGVSAYSVQDDLMTLFSAFGVDGRVNLVKILFHECYRPWHATDTYL